MFLVLMPIFVPLKTWPYLSPPISHLRSLSISRSEFQAGLKTHLFRLAFNWLFLWELLKRLNWTEFVIMSADFLHQPFCQLLPVLYNWTTVSTSNVEPVSVSTVGVWPIPQRSCVNVLSHCSQSKQSEPGTQTSPNCHEEWYNVGLDASGRLPRTNWTTAE